MHRSTLTLTSTLSILALAASISFGQGEALLVGADGAIGDWDHTPFSKDNGSRIDVNRGYTIADDYAPIDFPGIGRVPSPGGAAGERYDLEEMHIRRDGDTLEVLIVTSSPMVAEGRWLLGDLFVRAGDVRVAVALQDGGRGIAAGTVYMANDNDAVESLQPGEHGFAGDPRAMANDYGPDARVATVIGPWRFDGRRVNGQPIGSATIATARHDFGGDEDGTFLILCTIDLAEVGLVDHRTITARIAWGRGSDVITAGIGGPSLLNQLNETETYRALVSDGAVYGVNDAAAVFDDIPGVAGGSVGGGGGNGGTPGAVPPETQIAPIPEPASAMLMLLGAMLFTRRSPRR